MHQKLINISFKVQHPIVVLSPNCQVRFVLIAELAVFERQLGCLLEFVPGPTTKPSHNKIQLRNTANNTKPMNTEFKHL